MAVHSNRPSESALEAFRSVTILILNSSGTDLILANFRLTGGSWEKQPVSGINIKPSDHHDFVNFTDRTFTNVGGTINLSPVNGGEISIQWNWAWGSSITGSSTGSNLNGIAVSSTIINPNTITPTLQVMIVNAPSK
jgi:hypothetical protein